MKLSVILKVHGDAAVVTYQQKGRLLSRTLNIFQLSAMLKVFNSINFSAHIRINIVAIFSDSLALFL